MNTYTNHTDHSCQPSDSLWGSALDRQTTSTQSNFTHQNTPPPQHMSKSKNRRLLVIQPLTMPGALPEDDFIAVDNTHAGIGDTVLVNREGNGARQALQNPDGSVISLIVGIVDSLRKGTQISNFETFP